MAEANRINLNMLHSSFIFGIVNCLYHCKAKTEGKFLQANIWFYFHLMNPRKIILKLKTMVRPTHAIWLTKPNIADVFYLLFDWWITFVQFTSSLY